MHYAIEVVGEDELPQGTNAVIVERDERQPLLLINGVPGRVWEMMRAFEDTLESSRAPSVCAPLRLVPRRPASEAWDRLAMTRLTV